MLAATQRLLGDEHPDTLKARSNLAVTLAKLGSLANSREHQEAVLAATQRLLGDEHPTTLTARNNLATSLYDQENFASARVHQEAVLAATQRLLGDEHPDTLTARNNLAMTLSALGDLAGARKHQEAVLAVDATVARRRASHHDCGPPQPSLDALHSEGPRDAREHQEAVLAATQRLLGDEHPDTLKARKDLDLMLKMKLFVQLSHLPAFRVFCLGLAAASSLATAALVSWLVPAKSSWIKRCRCRNDIHRFLVVITWNTQAHGPPPSIEPGCWQPDGGLKGFPKRRASVGPRAAFTVGVIAVRPRMREIGVDGNERRKRAEPSCVRRHSEFSVRKSAIPDFIQFFEAAECCHAPGMTLVASDAQRPRPRRAYDHRLREHVVRCGPMAVAKHVHIPRSTVSTWRRRGLRPVVTIFHHPPPKPWVDRHPEPNSPTPSTRLSCA